MLPLPLDAPPAPRRTPLRERARLERERELELELEREPQPLWHSVRLTNEGSVSTEFALSSTCPPNAIARLAPRRPAILGPGRRHGHSLTSVGNGRRVYVFGGFGGFGDDRLSNDTFAYDTVDFTWSRPAVKGTVPSPRNFHTCSAHGDKLYVFGGNDGSHSLNDLYVLNTLDHYWEKLEPKGEFPLPREGHAAAVIQNRMFVFGGSMKTMDVIDEVYHNDVYAYDITSNSWSKILANGKPPVARDFHSCNAYLSNVIVFGGGDCCNSYLNDLHLLNTETLEWSEKKLYGEFMEPRGGHLSFCSGDNLFVFGGFTNGQNHLNDFYAIDLSSGHCTKQKIYDNIPSPRFCSSGDIIDNNSILLTIHGGCNSNFESLYDIFLLYPEEDAQIHAEEKSFQEMQREVETNSYAIVPKPKMEETIPRPTFLGRDGESARKFVSAMEKRFSTEKIPPEQWTWYGSSALRDKASGWYYGNLVSGKITLDCSWSSFCARLYNEFDDQVSLQMQLRDKLCDLQQGARTVEEYNSDFQELILQIQNMDAVDQVATYTRGLNSRIRNSVRNCMPLTVEEAMDHAMRMEAMDLRMTKRKMAAEGEDMIRGVEHEMALVDLNTPKGKKHAKLL